MSFESIMLLRFEVIISLIIFILLIMKLNDADNKAHVFLSVINVLLVLNFVAGLFPIGEGVLFSGFFKNLRIDCFRKEHSEPGRYAYCFYSIYLA